PPRFGARLNRPRRRAGLTQEQFAARAGHPPAYISLLERGERNPIATTAELLGNALQLADEDQAVFRAAAQRAAAAGQDEDSGPPLPVGAYLGAVPETPLVAREAQVGMLDAALSPVPVGAGRCLLLAAA